jgi:hypothetical protein
MMPVTMILALVIIIRLARKRNKMTGTNTLAYVARPLVTKRKSFMRLATGHKDEEKIHSLKKDGMDKYFNTNTN